MTSPIRPVRNKVVHNSANVVVVRVSSEEYGVSYHLYSPELFGPLSFLNLNTALQYAKDRKKP